MLRSYELAYETYGEINHDRTNIVLITHALSGSHHAAGLYDGDRKPGWWDDLIGDGKDIDTEKYFCICINNIGSCYGSTSPMHIDPATGKRYRLKFPVLTISDIVQTQMVLLKSLGIDRLHAVVGGSMGGMQALCYAIEYPTFARHIVALATTAYTRPWAIAFNKIAIEAIRNDSRFRNGDYDPKDIEENGLNGLAIGRMAGHVSYLSPHSMKKKFDNNYVDKDGLYELFGRYEVERYLEYNGYNFPTNFDPLSYLFIIKTMNIFNSARGGDSLQMAYSKVRAKLHLISFGGDMLFLPYEMEQIRDIMIDIGKEKLVSYKMIDSDYGHDAFLVEVDKYGQYLKEIIDE